MRSLHKSASSAALVVGVVVLVVATGCPGPAVHVPGKTKDVKLVVKLASLNEAELNGIGSFTLTLDHDGASGTPIALDFSASSKSLSFLGAAPDLPTTGKLKATLRAADLAGAGLPIGGTTSTLDLDAVPAGGSATLFAIVGRIGAPAPFDVELGSSTTDVAVAVGTGILFASAGGKAEWLDLGAGRQCKSTDTNGACNFGSVVQSPAVAVALDVASGYGASCPHLGEAVVGAGADHAVALFDPAGLDGAGAFTSVGNTAGPHTGGAAFATSDCRVIFVGGGSGVDVLDLSGTPSLTSSGGVTVTGGALVNLGNALGERALVGGTDEATPPNALDTAVLVSPSATGAQLCISGDASCNGEIAKLSCARETPAAARVDDGSDQSPTLILGGAACDGTDTVTHAAAEMLVSSTDAPFTRFLAVDAAPVTIRTAGAVLHSFGPSTLLLLGGVDVDGNATAKLETFALSAVDVASVVAHGTFTELSQPLLAARSGASLIDIGGAVVVAGGGSAKLEVIVPELP